MNIKITAENKNFLKITTRYDEKIVAAIKKIPGRRWLADEKAWIYPDLDSNTQLFLSEIYKLDNFNYPESPPAKSIDFSRERQSRLTPIQEMIRWMKIKDYSPKTIKAYKNQIRWFFERTALSPEEVTTEDIVLYIEKIRSLTGYSRTWIVQCISGLKCYYNHGFKTPVFNPANNIPLPKKNHNYPDILSRNEVKRIIEKGTLNIKHELLLSLVYSCGLRVSESVQVKLSDLDTERMMLHIRNTKSRRDRYVMLSDKILILLQMYKNRYFLDDWLFAGAKSGTHLTIRSAQAVFKSAVERVEIDKNVSIHSLRHAFATHLLEDGVDIRYIQELLGHKSSKTTEIYTHVTKTSLKNIRSPIDRW